MGTQIHAAGATGGVSPGLALAIEDALSGAVPEIINEAVVDYLTANPPSAIVVTDLDNGYLSI